MNFDIFKSPTTGLHTYATIFNGVYHCIQEIKNKDGLIKYRIGLKEFSTIQDAKLFIVGR